MSRRRKRDEPEQLILPPAPAAPKRKARVISAPEQAARVYIAKRATPSAVQPPYYKLTFHARHAPKGGGACEGP